MKQSHIDCQNSRCQICLGDSYKLEARLIEQTNTGRKFDLLGRYHKWLSDNKIPNETEWGWFSQDTFKEENINNFCECFNQQI